MGAHRVLLLAVALLLALAGVQAQTLVSYPTDLELESPADVSIISTVQVSGKLLSGSDLDDVSFTIHAQNADGAQMPFHQSIQCDEAGEEELGFGNEDTLLVEGQIDDGPPECVVFGTDFSEAAAFDSHIYVTLSGPTTGLLMVIAPTSPWAALQDDMVFSEDFEIIQDGCTSVSGKPRDPKCKPLTKNGPKQLGRYTTSHGVIRFIGAPSVIFIRRNTPCGARFDFTLALQHKIDCLQAPGCDWSECSATCGDGVQTRTLYTIRPPLNGGKECKPEIETQPCSAPTCDVDCEVSEWTWGTCSKTCGSGTITKTRTIITQPAGNGKACPVLEKTEPCNTDPCPVDCKMGDWTPWTQCSEKCDGGVQTRTRPILTPASNGGEECPCTEESQECNTQDCPVDCRQSEWGPWSSCSASCGQGTKTRTRITLEFPSNGGQACGDCTETAPCQECECPVDCEVSEWSAWSTCSKNCGTGVSRRTRTVTRQSANGGKQCPALVEEKECNKQGCPENCVMGEWSSWSTCSASCGGTGTQTRTREVIKPPKNGGAECLPTIETQPCGTQPCPVDCEVSDWCEWTQCSKKCGGGTSTRSRTILTPPAYGGAQCPPLTDTKQCNTHLCPQDCKLGDWCEWSQCSAKCGGGTKTRSRPVLTAPANGGAPCDITTETTHCNTQTCDVDCKVSDWSQWSTCDKPCDGGVKTRTRTITQQPQGNGAKCPALKETQACNTQGCAQDCVMGEYGPWSTCSATCGGGKQTRNRPIITPPKNGGDQCPCTEETQDCNTQDCPVDCVVSEWSSPSTCTATCGGGTTTRTRVILTPPKNNGASCPPLIDVDECNTQECPRDCVMNDWCEWSQCSATCGGGVQKRSRTVRVPPAFGGEECPDDLEETRTCNTQGCPVDCKLSDWCQWSQCSATCGGGTRTRTRTVLTQPSCGGELCGELSQIETCNTQDCPVDCEVSEWTEWSTCDKGCGGGKKTRTRTITRQPANGGAQCPVLIDEKECNTHGCPQDCVQGEWSPWSTCSASCGCGTQQRTRTTLIPAANGGKPCESCTEFQPCNTQKCTKECKVSEWKDWGSCSKKCGGGLRIRYRTITQFPGLFSGSFCPPLIDIEPCNTEPCDEDCEMGEWGEWGQCSAKCGGGTQKRWRSVRKPKCGAGRDCPPEFEERACNTKECDVDCKMGDWSGWSTCSKTCGGGTQTRTRKPVVKRCGQGSPCPPETETRTCNTRSCSNDCEMGEWGPWSQCSKECGGGVQTQTRVVKNPRCGNGKKCGALINQRKCNTQKCPKPPVDCKVSDWGSWSKCTKDCGGGVSTRTRRVLTQASNGGKVCPALTETKTCNTQECKQDCKVSDWSDWGSCSKTCGGGVQKRTRRVLSQPCSGGANCPNLEESRQCNTQSCKQDCEVSDWSAWSSCSKDCGTGIKTRTRTVTKPASGGGCSCPALKETSSCNTQKCKEDCKVSDWSNWSTCSKSCGGGKQQRTRKVLSKPCFGGSDCPDLIETRDCNTGVCAVDCVVSDFGPWSQCSKECGGGVSTRTRTRLQPANSWGKECPPLTESKPCNTQVCKDDCKVTEWGQWSTCSKTCGGGTQKRSRSVISQPCGGGKDCPDLTETRECNTGGCKVDCKVSDFGAWSSCSATCGGGIQTRKRTITQQPSNGGDVCPALTESKICNTQSCKSDCKVSDWTSWSTCSKSCGGGVSTRTRSILSQPCDGGASCPPLKETKDCNTQACVVDCKVSDWSDWSMCSKTCGGGTQTRKRVVTQYPCANGDKCPALTETRNCNTDTCTTDCKVSDWSAWSSCSKTCGGGLTTRTRKVLTQPCNGGAQCPPLTETGSCNTDPCKSDCKVSDWSQWSTCSKDCGGGVQTRSRTITQQACSGGAGCPALTDSQSCNTQSCSSGNCAQSCNNGDVAYTVSTDAIVVSYKNGIDSIDVNVKITYDNGKTVTLNYHPNKGATKGTTLTLKIRDFSGFPKTCASFCVTWVQVHGTNCHFGENGCAPICGNAPPQSCAWDYGEWGSCSNACGAGTQTRTAQCKTSSGDSCDASKCGPSSVVQSCSGNSCGMGCVATSCSGDGSQSQVSFAQGSSGTLDVTVKFTAPAFGDLRGFFLEFSPSSRLAGKASACQLLGSKITNFERDTRQLKCDSNVNLNGCAGPTSYDLAVVFGSNGLSKDDIRETSFSLVCKGYTLTVADVADARVGVRAQSVGALSFWRLDSTKQICTVTNNSGRGRRL